ncbi:uncharacterized protein BDCG_16887 [Blastomyces dermatitidis ER-3]|uniref:Uncharacterized protein n=2 Tax=Ajellomyces dermatitidis TaxID=5039 RepID=A0A0J9ENB2_AJEDA|nr:uncharacterized protein BDCG_16887 [Blastomyces dermatitidis ER-3]KMW67551.1 hypothetical protein BDDG_12181 [Blastomyces dermatitidis ATCC 18188]OAT01070.1 hypothetical protein BDCG_16887 [Blastomyces dermatitidis ER-3]
MRPRGRSESCLPPRPGIAIFRFPRLLRIASTKQETCSWRPTNPGFQSKGRVQQDVGGAGTVISRVTDTTLRNFCVSRGYKSCIALLLFILMIVGVPAYPPGDQTW